MSSQQSVQGPADPPGLGSTGTEDRTNAEPRSVWRRGRSEDAFIWPAALVLLGFSLFPLIVSLWLSFSRLKFVRGGVEVNFVGLANYRKLLSGSEQAHFLGVLSRPSLLGFLVFGALVLVAVALLVRYVRSKEHSTVGFILRLAFTLFALTVIWMLVSSLNSEGRPGTVSVTLIYVYVGIFFQYVIGLGLALLTAQALPGRRFFRVVFLLPMMITPVGVAYMFRMLADTSKGPFAPIWQAVGLGGTSWVNNPWGARAAVVIGDVWQWTAFMFIVLLAAVEAQPREPVEAAQVDGASRWKIFRYLTFPGILPVSTALLLIRMIEAYKIMDLPNVLTNGGPGTATESLTLHSFIAWRTLDIGVSAAIAYMLLILVTVVSIAFVNLVRSRTTEAV
jgi:multiple sugar transport system permease protein